MTSIERMPASAGRTAPSFVATIAAIVLLVAGYLAWDILRPSPVARSEMIVRDFSAAAAAELGPLRKALRDEAARYKADPATVAEVRAAIDARAAEVRASIESLAADATDDLEMLEGINLQTQENRLQRIQQKKADAQARIDGLAAEVRAQLPQD